MGVESGGGGAEGTHPPVTNLGGDARFENEMAQIRSIFLFLGYFGGRLAICRRFVPHSKNRGDAPD